MEGELLFKSGLLITQLLRRTLQSVERFNVTTGKWVQCANLAYPRMGIACTKFHDKIWTAGGMSGSKRQPLSSSVEYYDIEKDQ